jgi:hypothetical protein
MRATSNPKSESRNPKEIRIMDQRPKTVGFRIWVAGGARRTAGGIRLDAEGSLPDGSAARS